MRQRILGPYILGSALIWGATILGTALLPGDAKTKAMILSVISGGAGSHLILIWGPLAAAFKKLREHGGEEQTTELGS